MTRNQIKQKALGQHFLGNAEIIEKITSHAVQGLENEGYLIEIGPGKGALTHALWRKFKGHEGISGVLFETDRELCAQWRSEISRGFKATLIEGDFLDTFPKWMESMNANEKQNCTVVSNLPYSAGTAIICELVRWPNQIRKMTLMHQKEVASKLIQFGDGSLSLFVQDHWEISKLFDVGPENFLPPPKVDSTVVSLAPREAPLFTSIDNREEQSLFSELLRMVYSQRRKMLRKVISGAPRAFSAPLQSALESSKIDPTLRAEALELAQWQAFWGHFQRAYRQSL